MEMVVASVGAGCADQIWADPQLRGILPALMKGPDILGLGFKAMHNCIRPELSGLIDEQTVACSDIKYDARLEARPLQAPKRQLYGR